MGLGFLVPAFLAALAALAVPLVMHLRDRNEQSPTRFPSLMFLQRLPIRTSDRRTVTDWPLLLLRALAVALLVLAFTRPFFGRPPEQAAAGRQRAVVVLLDRSMSMGYEGTWAGAQDSVRTVLDALGAADQVALVLFDQEAEVAQTWTADKATVRAVVDATRPVARGTRLGAGLRAARSALAGAPPGAPEIIVVTDLQRSGLGGVAGLELPKGLPIRVVFAAPPARPNTAVRAVEARRVTEGGRTQLHVLARVLGRELGGPRTVRARLSLAGREVASRTVTLPPNGEIAVMFDPVPAPGTAVQGEVQLDADALPGDDRFHFALRADDALGLAVVVPDDLAPDELLYLERALAIGRAPAVRVERRRAGTLDAATLARSAAVLLWDAAPPTGAARAALDAWAERGGGLVMYAGSRSGLRRPGDLLGVVRTSGLADRRMGGGAMLGDVRSDHPLFAPFRAAPQALGAPRFHRYARLEAAAGSEVLARFDDGSPAVVERRVGEGRVLVLATALDAREGDLPLQPAFLPLARRLVLHAAAYDDRPLWRWTGESWAPLGLRGAVVSSPSGALFRPATDAPGTPFAVTLQEVGVYAAYDGRVDGAPRDRVAVNVGPGESDLVAASANELLLGVAVSNDSTLRGVSVPTALEIESRQRVWRWLVLLAVALLAAESVIASRGWRGRARRATIVATEGTTP